MARIVMIHGLGCDARFWAPQAEALRLHGHDVAAPDLPYHGGPTEGVEASLRGLAAWVRCELGERPAVLVGHSLGGMIALQVAHDAPELVTGIVLVDAFPSIRLNLANLPEMFVDGAHREVRRWVEQRREEVLRRRAEATYEAIWASVCEFDAREWLGRITAPVLGIYGGRGEYRRGDEERLRNDLALDRVGGRTHVVVVEGAGHFVNLEEAETVSAALAEWLAAGWLR